MVLADGQFRVVFTARDFEASKSFYQDGLGLEVDHEWDYGPDDRGIVFKAASGMIEIFPLAPGADYTAPRGLSLLIQVSDVDKMFEEALSGSMPVLAAPQDYPWGHRVLRLTDPDGIVVSLFTPIPVK